MPIKSKHPKLFTYDWDAPGDLICRALDIDPWQLRLIFLIRKRHQILADEIYPVMLTAGVAYWLRHFRPVDTAIDESNREFNRIRTMPRDSRHLEIQAYVHDVWGEAAWEMLGQSGSDVRAMYSSTGHAYKRDMPPVVLESDRLSCQPLWAEFTGLSLDQPFEISKAPYGYRARNVCAPGWKRRIERLKAHNSQMPDGSECKLLM